MSKIFTTLFLVFLIVGIFSCLVVPETATAKTTEISPDFEIPVGTMATALENMTTTVTDLLVSIIPIFIILGVFGAVFAMIKKISGPKG